MAYRKSTRTRSYSKKAAKKPYSPTSPVSWKAAAFAGLSGLALTVLKNKLGLNTEKHYFDTIETNVGTSSAAQALSYPTLIPQGDGINSRQGASCRLTSYNCKIRLQSNAAATTPCMIRVIFVRFRDTRGANPGAADFMDSTTRITSHFNMGDDIDSIGFTVLYDRTVQMPVYTDTDSTKLLMFNYKPLSHHLKWTSADTTGNVVNLQDGYIRGFIMTSETGANTPNYWADHRVKFVDN